MNDSARFRFPDEVIAAIRAVEVASLFFPYAMRSWIIDLRPSADSGPKVTVEGIVASPQERLQSFRRLRPDLPNPDELTIIPWIGHVRQLEETGVLDAIFQRCRAEGGETLVAQATECYQALVVAETAIKRQIILGVGMQPLWRRTPADR
jgi:hypothetical protein